MLHGCIMQLFSRFVLVLVDGRYGHGLRKWPGVVQDLHMLWTSPIPSSDTMHGSSVIDLIYCLSAYLVLILHQQHRTSGDCRAKLWWLYCPELPRSKQAGRGKPNYVSWDNLCPCGWTRSLQGAWSLRCILCRVQGWKTCSYFGAPRHHVRVLVTSQCLWLEQGIQVWMCRVPNKVCVLTLSFFQYVLTPYITICLL